MSMSVVLFPSSAGLEEEDLALYCETGRCVSMPLCSRYVIAGASAFTGGKGVRSGCKMGVHSVPSLETILSLPPISVLVLLRPKKPAFHWCIVMLPH